MARVLEMTSVRLERVPPVVRPLPLEPTVLSNDSDIVAFDTAPFIFTDISAGLDDNVCVFILILKTYDRLVRS
jgi:hypothetical protein